MKFFMTLFFVLGFTLSAIADDRVFTYYQTKYDRIFEAYG